MPGDLVTGGAGFIGSHLVDALLARGRRVTVLDDFSTGTRENLTAADVEIVEGSVLDERLVEDLVAAHERVFHLAAVVGVSLVAENAVRTVETNAIGTANVLRVAALSGRPCLVISSSETYGKSAGLPFREDGDLVLGPSSSRRWAYACSKLLGEFLALAHAAESDLPVVAVRLFNTTGPRQIGRYGMVLPRFVSRALAGEPLPVYGDGEQTRCFCDVADVAPALADLLDCDVRGEVVNLGGTEPITINDLARMVIEETNSTSEIVHVPYPDGIEDMRERVPDVSKARRLIGFEPRIDLRTTIRRLADHLRP